MVSPADLDELFLRLAREQVDVDLTARASARLLLGYLHSLGESADDVRSRERLRPLLEAVIVTPTVDRRAFERAFQQWSTKQLLREELRNESTAPVFATSSTPPRDALANNRPDTAISRRTAVLPSYAGTKQAVRRFYAQAADLAREAAKRATFWDGLAGITLIAVAIFVYRAWPKPPVQGALSTTEATRPLPKPPGVLPDLVLEPRVYELAALVLATFIVLAAVFFIVAVRKRTRGLKYRAHQRDERPPPPQADPHSPEELRKVVFELGLVDTPRPQKLDALRTARETARNAGLATLVMQQERRTPDVWLVPLQPLDPWTRDIVMEFHDALRSFGVTVHVHDRERSWKVQDGDCALLVGDATAFRSEIEFERVCGPWTQGLMWALLEARDPARWGSEVADVFPCDPLVLTPAGVESALRVAFGFQPRPAPLLRSAPAAGIAGLGDALPFALVAAFLEPLDFAELSELRRLHFKNLAPLAVQRFLSLPGVTEDARGANVTADLRRALLQRYEAVEARISRAESARTGAQPAAPSEGVRRQVAARWRIAELDRVLRDADKSKDHVYDPVDATALRERALAKLDEALLTETPGSVDMSTALEHLLELKQTEPLRAALERRLARRGASTRFEKILDLATGSDRRRAVELGLVHAPLARAWLFPEGRRFLQPRAALAGVAVLGIAGYAVANMRVERCPPGKSLCGDLCFDLNVDPAHCGSCTRFVKLGSACEGGKSVPICKDTQCGSECVDTSSSVLHCGGCDTPCLRGHECSEGKCREPCAPCPGKCAVLDNDPAHCGRCGHACASNEICEGGACKAGAGILCGGSLLSSESLRNDPNNCGACGKVCDPRISGLSGRCRGGMCEGCRLDERNCNGSVLDGCEVYIGMPPNCGGCGKQCSVGPNQSPSCQYNGKQFVCGTVCESGRGDCTDAPGCETNVSNNVAHCGACGNSCTCENGLTPSCTNGKCTCPGCPPGQTRCGNVCVDIATDINNCGRCGRGCRTTTCVDGMCREGANFCERGWFDCDADYECESNRPCGTPPEVQVCRATVPSLVEEKTGSYEAPLRERHASVGLIPTPETLNQSAPAAPGSKPAAREPAVPPTEAPPPVSPVEKVLFSARLTESECRSRCASYKRDDLECYWRQSILCTGLCACFTAGTSVLTEDGYVAIESLVPGQLVWSYDDSDERWGWSAIVRIWEHAYSGELVTLETNGASVTATANHPFCVATGEGGISAEFAGRPSSSCPRGFDWTNAGSLASGRSLANDSGERSIDSVYSFSAQTRVYNIEVERSHTYTVTRANILVHNK